MITGYLMETKNRILTLCWRAFVQLTPIVVAFGLLFSCSDDGIPDDLDEAMDGLENEWKEEKIEDFKSKPEDDAVTSEHFAQGAWIRNHWLNDTQELMSFFESHGVYHRDDMSATILRSFHRRLNGRPIDLEGQAEYYRNWWAENEKRLKEN